jgi:hypothetical protein
MNKLWLTFFFFFFASFLLPLDKKDLSKPICLNPEKTGSVEHSSGVGALLTLGLSLAGKFECAFYDNLSSSRDRKTASDCRELMCRAKNRSQIVERGKNIIKLSEQAIKENNPGTSRTTLNRGINKIEKGIEQWNKVNTVSANATVDNVNTKTLEKHLNIPLEKFINDQFSSLPKDLQSSYKTERKRIYEEELEKKRIAAEKKRKEQEAKRKKEMQIQAQIKKEAELEKARQTTNLFFIFLGLGGVIAVALTLSHRRAMKELELSIASASGAKDSFFSDNNINLDSLSSETDDERGNVKSETDEKTQDQEASKSKSKSFFETNEIDITKTFDKEDKKTDPIEVINFEYDYYPDFDPTSFFNENISSFNWIALRQIWLHYSIQDSHQYPNKKACIFSPQIFAQVLSFVENAHKVNQKSKYEGEEYFGESKDIKAYTKISEEVSLLVEPWQNKREELTNLFETDEEIKSLTQLAAETKEKKEKELIRSKLLKRGLEIKEMFKELEADILKEVELIIYRSELAEEFKKKLISLLPEAVGVDY